MRILLIIAIIFAISTQLNAATYPSYEAWAMKSGQWVSSGGNLTRVAPIAVRKTGTDVVRWGAVSVSKGNLAVWAATAIVGLAADRFLSSQWYKDWLSGKHQINMMFGNDGKYHYMQTVPGNMVPTALEQAFDDYQPPAPFTKMVTVVPDYGCTNYQPRYEIEFSNECGTCFGKNCNYAGDYKAVCVHPADYLTSGNCYTEGQPQTVERTREEVAQMYKNDLDSTNDVNDSTSQAATDIEKQIAADFDNSAAGGESPSLDQGTYGSELGDKLRDRINNDVSTSLSGTTVATSMENDASSQTTPGSDITSSVNTNNSTGSSPFSLTSLISALRTIFGLDKPVPDITNTGVNETENDTALDQTGLDNVKTQEQQKTQTAFGNILTSMTGLKNKIMNFVNGSIGTGSGVCSISCTVFDHLITFSFCEIDFSTLHTLMIAVAGIVAAIILIM